ncbi:MAG: phenylalanine--tRNA ligase subunit beta [Legionellales bacterium]|nr:phenylalanine--tRNA ligase subunit beta [Legionellales bacterium]
MKISEKWLREWVDPDCDLATLSHKLTMAGLEVENTSPVAAQLEKVVVAEVLDVQPHPNADKLRICQVNIGQVVLQIVCGAKNVASGQKVVAALIGADLGNDFVIKPARLRGVESSGMLCSASELGLAEESEGILVLPSDAPIGTEINEYLQLNDHIIEISLTPNRGDCLSIAGLAREMAALTGAKLTPPDIQPVQPSIDETLPISVGEAKRCPFYAGRIIKGINPKAATPLWMAEKLRRSGLRSIHPVVDTLNYVMLELGQPMHGFDLSKLDEEIAVRLARPDETLTLLDGKTVSLDSETLVIADKYKVLALAGIMGGTESAVSEQTESIFLESAFFNPKEISGRARAYSLQTDASYRFERGVDPLLPEKAMERATALLLMIVGGQPGPMISIVKQSALPEKKVVHLALAKINSTLGTTILAEWIEEHLPRLGFTLIQKSGDTWEVTVPSHRLDITIEADLIEEVARLYGYDNIPYTMPMVKLASLPKSESNLSLRRVKQILVARDYCEAITYSFVDPRIQELFDPEIKPCALLNPTSPELSVMRTSIWQGLITAYCQNEARQSARVRLFESGLCFIPLEDFDGSISKERQIKQPLMLAGLCAGAAYPLQWGAPNRPLDFFDVKNDIEALLALRHDTSSVEFIPANLLSLHPGRSAAIVIGGQTLGYVGELHPRIMSALNLRQTVYLFELELEHFLGAQLPLFSAVSKFPSVRRDIAIVIEQSISIDAIKQLSKDVCGSLLVDWQLFDVYQGKNIMENHRSLAFQLTLQHTERTLTDSEVTDCVARLIAELRDRFEASLRE